MFDISNTVISGIAASGEASIPSMSMDAYTGHSADIKVPLLTASGVLAAGRLGTGVGIIPRLTIDASGIAQAMIIGSSEMPALSAVGVGLAANLSTVASTLPLFRTDAVGYAGSIATAAISLPATTLAATGFPAYSGVAAFTLPSLQIAAVGYPALVDNTAAQYSAWVMNLRTGGLTGYTGYSFNSFAVFNGRLLGAGPSGVVDVAPEAGSETVDWAVSTASTDFETSQPLRVNRLYIEAAAPKDLEVATVTSQDGERAYLYVGNANAGMQRRPVSAGIGVKSHYWQFRVLGRNGSPVRLKAIGVYAPQSKLRRRVV
jgi:hypothetical protein